MKRVYKYKDRYKLRPDFFVNRDILDFEKEIDDEMYPVDEYRVKVLLRLNIPVYRFDIQDEVIKRYKVRNTHVLHDYEYYGVARKDWDKFVKSEESYPFMYLWDTVSSAANSIFCDKPINDDRLALSGYNGTYIEESNGLENYFDERGDDRESRGLPEVYFSAKDNFDDVQKYLFPLLIEYASRLYDNEIYHGCDADFNRILLELAGEACLKLSYR